jgi:hypothetical protein
MARLDHGASSKPAAVPRLPRTTVAVMSRGRRLRMGMSTRCP